MYKRIILWLLIVNITSMSSVFSQTIKNGFREFEWGKEIKEFPSSIFEKTSVDKYIEDPTAILISLRTNFRDLGGVKLTYLAFDFFEGKFYGIHGPVIDDLKDKKKKFPAILESVYGKPTFAGRKSHIFEQQFEGFGDLMEFSYNLYEWNEEITYRKYVEDKIMHQGSSLGGDNEQGSWFEMYSKKIKENVDDYKRDQEKLKKEKAKERKRIQDSLDLENAKKDF